MPFDADYATYYDLLYKDKDYRAEVDYVCSLIKKRHKGDATTLLDVGCGTGRHAAEFVRNGFATFGLDCSKDMIEKARAKVPAVEFHVGYSYDFSLGRRMDIAVSLFHVMSYQTTNRDLFASFQNISRHLNNGGVFIFDFWYGSAVLREMPEVRVRRFENEDVQVVRVAEPMIHWDRNVVDVGYEIIVMNKRNGAVKTFKETHSMRYFFIPELLFLLESAGFEVDAVLEWLSERQLPETSWCGVIVARKR